MDFGFKGCFIVFLYATNSLIVRFKLNIIKLRDSSLSLHQATEPTALALPTGSSLSRVLTTTQLRAKLKFQHVNDLQEIRAGKMGVMAK